MNTFKIFGKAFALILPISNLEVNESFEMKLSFECQKGNQSSAHGLFEFNCVKEIHNY